MNVVVYGADSLGIHVANILSKEEINVSLIDFDSAKIAKAAKDADFATYVFPPSDWKIFEDLKESKPEFFIALTSNDESNLASCAIAKNLGYPRTVCKVSHDAYLRRGKIDFGTLFYVDHFIGTEILAAYQIFKTLLSPSHLYIEEFAHGTIVLRSCKIPQDWEGIGLPLKQLKLPDEMIIGLIQRKEGEKDLLLFPHGDDSLLANDQIIVISDAKEMQKMKKIFSLHEERLKHVVIVGGSQVGISLAHLMIKYGVDVKILEQDEKKCKFLAELLPKATILNHDAKDLNFLNAEKVQQADAFISCTHHDEENLLLSALAKEANCERVIALLTDISLTPALKRIGVTHSFSEKAFTTDRILSILHAKNILSIYSLADDRAKVVEIKVSERSKVIGVPISELGPYLPSDLLIAMIESKGKVMIGKGNRVISPNDTIIILTHPDRINDIRNLF